MNNWILELEKEIGIEETQFAVNVIAASITLATIFIGNWYMLM